LGWGNDAVEWKEGKETNYIKRKVGIGGRGEKKKGQKFKTEKSVKGPNP